MLLYHGIAERWKSVHLAQAGTNQKISQTLLLRSQFQLSYISTVSLIFSPASFHLYISQGAVTKPLRIRVKHSFFFKLTVIPMVATARVVTGYLACLILTLRHTKPELNGWKQGIYFNPTMYLCLHPTRSRAFGPTTRVAPDTFKRSLDLSAWVQLMSPLRHLKKSLVKSFYPREKYFLTRKDSK